MTGLKATYAYVNVMFKMGGRSILIRNEKYATLKISDLLFYIFLFINIIQFENPYRMVQINFPPIN